MGLLRKMFFFCNNGSPGKRELLQSLFSNHTLNPEEIRFLNTNPVSRWAEKWKPAYTYKCLLNLDATDPSGNGILPSNNTALAPWIDKSIASNNATQLNNGFKPTWMNAGINNMPSVVFDDSLQQVLNVPNLPDMYKGFSIFLVALSDQDNSANTFANFISINGDARQPLMYAWKNKSDRGVNYSVGNFDAQPVIVTNGIPFYFDGYYDGATILGSCLNGKADRVNTCTQLVTNSFPGSIGLNFRGKISEIILINRKVTAAERFFIRSYITRKWRF
jgi:hypothetical protein